MRSKIVKQIFKKEMLDIIRDKKTIFMMIILPIILYPILMVGMSSFMMMSMSKMQEEDINIAFSSKPSSALVSILEKENKDDGKVNIVKSTDKEKDLEGQKIDAYVEIENKDNAKNYKIYANSSKENSMKATSRIKKSLDEYKRDIVEDKIEEQGLNVGNILEPLSYEDVEVAKDEEIAGHMLGQFLPVILIVGVLLGAIYPAIDVMAGEKERGTLETLFTLPITNLELVMGKYLAVSFCAILTAILNIASILLTMVYLVASAGLGEQIGISMSNMNQLVLPGIITIICVGLFSMVVSAISMCVCSLAKSFKDAQNYITPVMLFVMIPSYVSMIPTIKLDNFTAAVPVVNISLLIKSVLTFNSDINLISLVFISNFAFVILSVLLLSKMFNSEEILFGGSKSFSFLEKRSNIKKGTMPSVSDGAILYAVGLVLLIYVGIILQLKFKMVGVGLTQVMIITLPLLFAFYIKTDFKKTFSLKMPSIKHIIGGIVLWAGAYIFMNIVIQVILHFFPQNMDVIEALNETIIIKDNFILNLLVVALMPAICEEMFFRGFIYTSFKGKNSYKAAIVCSGILFGFMHMDFIRIIPTSILGISFAYCVYKSGSIFVPMILHFINNMLSVTASHYSDNEILNRVFKFLEINFKDFNVGQFIALLFMSAILIAIGVWLLKGNKSSKKEVKNNL
ncbi:ABC transporter permease subunit/CPBP intramembrane protease [Clostridium sp. CCUG 7971]|uniref:ABC transporter permease subunit/CPBP intramembrane protease n=1 Tax=Clostridium sp. CCUG 7971 TaxID=2811414 RepID=UPI001ABBCB7C|nr:ABC transporter permease subunit/CPBP intramembrane protease [Clostridium sp. CCUG 7971]MBO3445579.1 CPBP family intramembrane metalloprotease [Clostridium sp. CCUG 7971]